MHIVSVGVPVMTDPTGGWSFWPLLSIPLALLIAFRWLAFARRWWIALIAIVLGLASADAISAWGVLPVAVATAGFVAIGSMAVGRRHRRPPPV